VYQWVPERGPAGCMIRSLLMFPSALRTAVDSALSAAFAAGDLPDLSGNSYVIERPRDRDNGDWAANIALVSARDAKMAPRAIAEVVAQHLPTVEHVASVEVAGPGFLNFTLAPSWYLEVLRSAATVGPDFARAESGSGDKVQVEFVSSNPTGPLHIGHARGGVTGDVLCRLLEFSGDDVSREYYYNDAGAQMDRYGHSLTARYLQAAGRDVAFPEDGYPGHYLIDWAADLLEEVGDSWVDEPDLAARVLTWGTARAMRDMEETLDLARIRFDSWFSETTVHERGEVAEAIGMLRERGHVFDEDGAVWFRTTTFGDEKDRVLIKSDGNPTYLAPDVAYHLDKFHRGFDRLINIWGADHHGYIPRMKAAVEALGFDPDCLEIVITQTVNLTRGGELVRMTMRGGEFVTFREVIEEVGIDAVRYYLSAVSPDTALTFDLEEAKRQSMDNPVYYLQYAHARVKSLEGFATDAGLVRAPMDDADLTVLTDPAEIGLLKQIDRLGEEVMEAAYRRAPHRVATYGQDLAVAFHKFYADCKVVTDDPAVAQARLWLVEGAKSAVLAVLGLLGLSAPDRM